MASQETAAEGIHPMGFLTGDVGGLENHNTPQLQGPSQFTITPFLALDRKEFMVIKGMHSFMPPWELQSTNK